MENVSFSIQALITRDQKGLTTRRVPFIQHIEPDRNVSVSLNERVSGTNYSTLFFFFNRAYSTVLAD